MDTDKTLTSKGVPSYARLREALSQIETYFANEGQANPAFGIIMGIIAASEVRE